MDGVLLLLSLSGRRAGRWWDAQCPYGGLGVFWWILDNFVVVESSLLDIVSIGVW